MQTETYLGGNECATDAETSAKVLELQLKELEQQIEALGTDAPLDERLRLTLDMCYSMLQANMRQEAWDLARETLDRAVGAELWLRAVEACDVMFQTEANRGGKGPGPRNLAGCHLSGGSGTECRHAAAPDR